MTLGFSYLGDFEKFQLKSPYTLSLFFSEVSATLWGLSFYLWLMQKVRNTSLFFLGLHKHSKKWGQACKKIKQQTKSSKIVDIQSVASTFWQLWLERHRQPFEMHLELYQEVISAIMHLAHIFSPFCILLHLTGKSLFTSQKEKSLVFLRRMKRSFVSLFKSRIANWCMFWCWDKS